MTLYKTHQNNFIGHQSRSLTLHDGTIIAWHKDMSSYIYSISVRGFRLSVDINIIDMLEIEDNIIAMLSYDTVLLYNLNEWKRIKYINYGFNGDLSKLSENPRKLVKIGKDMLLIYIENHDAMQIVDVHKDGRFHQIDIPYKITGVIPFADNQCLIFDKLNHTDHVILSHGKLISSSVWSRKYTIVDAIILKNGNIAWLHDNNSVTICKGHTTIMCIELTYPTDLTVLYELPDGRLATCSKNFRIQLWSFHSTCRRSINKCVYIKQMVYEIAPQMYPCSTLIRVVRPCGSIRAGFAIDCVDNQLCFYDTTLNLYKLFVNEIYLLPLIASIYKLSDDIVKDVLMTAI